MAEMEFKKLIQIRLKHWPVPQVAKQLLSFIGFVNYHKDFIPNFGNMLGISLRSLEPMKMQYIDGKYCSALQSACMFSIL